MKDTFFRPGQAVHERIAPTQYHGGKMLCGYVNDPTCYAMGGVSGHAGLFATADNLSVFAEMLLNKGNMKGIKILKPQTVEQMTIPQSPLNKPRIRGLGWDVEAPFGSNRDSLLPVGAYGHLGYTGASIWIDPVTEIYIIILANRIYQNGRGNIKELRATIKSIVAEALGPISHDQILVKRSGLMDYYKHKKNAESPSSAENKSCEE
jgi:CubicO group peptidase (beta-lactamase class C family)